MGKIRQRFYKEGISEYLRRLSPFCKVSIEEVEEMGDPLREGDNILRRLEGKDRFVVSLDEGGEALSSVELSRRLESVFAKGKEMVFVLGGVRGLSPLVKERSEEVWSLSRLTFTHELARLILLEQIYRAFKIMRGEPYHY